MTGTAIDRRSLGRRLTILTDASVADVLAVRGGEPLLRGSSAHRVGFTGPPGAGKSTLIGALACRRLERARPVGIVCVDPTSPTTGGSILGDRIRIDGAVEHGDLFVRSVPSRRSEDGLSDNLPDLMAALAEQPFDELWLETVGVGQASLGVRRCVDTVVVLVLPGAGDTVQAMKAGILEIGDVCVVTKGDQPGAEQMANEMAAVLVRHQDDGWRTPVIVTSAADGRGLDELDAALDAHRAHVGDDRAASAAERARYDIERLVHRRVSEIVAELDPSRTDVAGAYRFVLERLGAMQQISTERNST